MKIDFFRANEQNAPTTEHYLFSDDYGQIMNGQCIENSGQNYQVTGQTIADKKGDAHIVFLYPVQRRATVIDL